MKSTNQLNRRNFLRYTGAILSTGTLLAACTSKDADPTPDEPGTVTHNISCWGDSLTSGSGGKPYASILKELLPERNVSDYGIAGQHAREIAARQGGYPIEITLEGNAFAGRQAVNIINLNTRFLSTGSNTNTYSSKGKLAEVACEITRTVDTTTGGVEVYTIKPLESSTVAVPANSIFIPDDSVSTQSDTQFLWIGRNNTPNFSGVEQLIESCINHLNKPARFAVIGVLSGLNELPGSEDFDSIKAFNELLASKYAANFIPSTPPTQEEMEAINYVPSEQDKIDIANGSFPTGMHSENIHLNNRGYHIIAKRVEAFLKKNPSY